MWLETNDERQDETGGISKGLIVFSPVKHQKSR